MSEPSPVSGAPATARVDLATSAIRSMIMLGEAQPGSRLRAESLAEKLHISPTPIREAFQRLAAEGLVVYSSQRGVRVSAASNEEMFELYELRLQLEPWAAIRSITRMNENEREEIRAADAALTRWLAEPQSDLRSPEYERLHQDFHRALIGACGSVWLIRIAGMLSVAATRYRHLTGGQDLHAIAAFEHAQLARLTLAGDVEGAVAAQIAHLRGTEERASGALSARGDTPAGGLSVPPAAHTTEATLSQ